MQDDIVIRALQPTDVEQWRRLRLEALRTSPAAFSSSYDDAQQLPLSAFTAHIPPPDRPSILIGAFDGQTLSGSVGIHVPTNPKLSHRGEIWGVYVTPERRGRGIATRLMQAAIPHARRHVSHLLLAVGTDNDAARRLYRKLGFVSYGIERKAIRVNGVDHDNDLMALHFET